MIPLPSQTSLSSERASMPFRMRHRNWLRRFWIRDPARSILDACAAPGGKTTHIAQRMGNEGKIYALDLTVEKLKWIEEGCRRLGVTMVNRVRGDARRALPVPEGTGFDRILADVPCSGFGTLRRNPDLKWRKGTEDIMRLRDLQSSILNNLSGYLSPGGTLVYSTCTVFHEENEDVVEEFLSHHPEFRLDPIGKVLPESCASLYQRSILQDLSPG